MLTRRELLRRSGLAATGLALSPVAVGCASVPLNETSVDEGGDVVLGLHRSADLGQPEDAIWRTLEHVDLGWLSPGDSVFIKVACNSGNRHPAVTSPTAVRAMVRALKDRGAGDVLVGDQSGVASVRLVEGERRFSSTRALMAGNGLLDAIEDSGAEPHFFDDHGFEDGYVEADFDAELFPLGSSWARPAHIARVTTEVDHIVYLGRLSSHLMTGYTCGHKISVGWMRDDTRHDMHHDAAAIFEKYTELNYCQQIRSRFRLAVTYADEILTTCGPDQGTIATADPRVVIASSHLANHDVACVTMLNWAQEHLGNDRFTGGLPYGPWASAVNHMLPGLVLASTGMPWSSGASLLPSTYVPHAYGEGIESDRALTRAYELLGGVPRRVPLSIVGAQPDEALAAVFDAHERIART